MSRRAVPAFRLVPEPLTSEVAELVPDPWADPSIGTRHRLAGEPGFFHEVPFPRCRSCGEEMTFYAPVDSLNSREWDLADAGLIFVFVCFDCFETEAILQSG